MTIQAITEAIKRLIEQRRNAFGNEKEQERINTKLSKLYDLKFVMLEQNNK